MLFRRFVLFARNSGGKFGKVVKEKLVMLFCRLVLFARNVGRNRENDNNGELRPKFAWPHIMNSSDLDLASSACRLASPLLPNSQLKAA
jgi:hypothetical protein